MSSQPRLATEPGDLSDQDIRELENPEVACAVDALLDFMECFPESWGMKPKGSIVPLPKRQYDSVWLSEYLCSFLFVPYFIEAPEIRAWLLKANLRADLQSLRQATQSEVLQRVKEERPDMLDKIEELMQREEAQFLKNIEFRDLVFKRSLLWMKKNKQWIELAERPLSELPEILSVVSSCYIELDPAHLLEELKMRQHVEIAQLEPEETDSAQLDEVVWHLKHLDLKPRRYHSSSNFSCGRLIVLIVVLAIFSSGLIQILQFAGLIQDPKQAPRY